MTTTTQEVPTNLPNTWHMVRAMGGVGILCAILIVFTFQVSLPIINKNKAEFLEKAIYRVLPGATTQIEFMRTQGGGFELSKYADSRQIKVYAGYSADNKLIGIAIDTQGKGFQDVIRILYGYSPDKQAVIGTRVLESKETPGLGDKIEKDEHFLENFIKLDVSLDQSGNKIKNPIVLVKKNKKNNPWEIDAITGATISSRAMAAILMKSTTSIVPEIYKHLKIFQNQGK